MESDWRWNREMLAPGGFMGDSPYWGPNPVLRYMAELITPISFGLSGIATHIAVGPRFAGFQRYWLGKLVPVGTNGAQQFQWLATGVSPGFNKFPIPAFPVHDDTP